nr:DUF3822 family protein [Siphonobacter sp. BAB-5385]
MTAATHFRQEALSLTSVSSYILTLGLGSQELQISIIDPARNRCLWLDEYALMEVNTEEEYLTAIQRLLSEHELTQKTFWKAVRVIISNQSFTLVPTSLFRKEYAARALSLARGLVTSHESVQHTVHPAWEAVTVFPYQSAGRNGCWKYTRLKPFRSFTRSIFYCNSVQKLRKKACCCT